MTTLHQFYLATFAGAVLFFLAGAAFAAMRRRPQPVAVARPVDCGHASELARLRGALTDSEVLAQEHSGRAAALQRSYDTLERQLAERTASARELSTENERLRARLADAEALRADYVRLRTTVTESEFLKGEVVRLQEELRLVKLDALGAPVVQRRRPARGSATPSPRTIAQSLTTIIEGFADPGTRSSAIADTLGFPLASAGDDGVALAAYGALLVETAARAKQFLPIASPAAVEIIDDRGARISVWTFEVEGDPLFLVNLAVTPVDASRVEATLAEAAATLAPSTRVDLRRAT